MRDSINIDVVFGVCELMDTIKNGLDHIEIQIGELRYEESFIIFYNIVEALYSIEKIFINDYGNLLSSEIKAGLSEFKNAVSFTVSLYEQKKENDIGVQIVGRVIPAFNRLDIEVKKLIRPYILS